MISITKSTKIIFGSLFCFAVVAALLYLYMNMQTLSENTKTNNPGSSYTEEKAQPTVPARTEKKARTSTRTYTALTGAVIVNQDGTRVEYRDKCEACGTVALGTHTSNFSVSRSFTCMECHAKQEVKIGSAVTWVD